MTSCPDLQVHQRRDRPQAQAHGVRGRDRAGGGQHAGELRRARAARIHGPRGPAHRPRAAQRQEAVHLVLNFKMIIQCHDDKHPSGLFAGE